MDLITLISIGLGVMFFGFFNGIGTATANWYFSNYLQHHITNNKPKSFLDKVFKFFGVDK